MPKLILQILWLNNSLGLAVNQKTPEGCFPLTSYYLWPISEAWEQLKVELDSKPWIDEAERVRVLNLVVEVMNNWQKSRLLSSHNENFGERSDIKIIGQL